MAFDREAAKAAGYTEEEINAYLQDKPESKEVTPVAPGQEVEPGEPPPPTTSVTPAGEGNYAPAFATAALAVPAAAVGAGGVLGVQKAAQMINAFRNPEPGTARNPIGSQPSRVVPIAPGPTGPTNIPVNVSAQPTETGVMSQARNIVQKLALDKVLKGAGVAAGAYELGKGLFGTSPEEIEILKQAEARKRAQGWKPLNER